MKNLHEYRIKLFGNGLEVHFFKLPISELEKLKSYTFENQINYIYYKCYGMSNERESWLNTFKVHSIYGLTFSNMGSIELKENGRRIRKIKTSDLLQDDTIFPLYRIENKTLDTLVSESWNIAYIMETTGLISDTTFQAEQLRIDKMLFQVISNEPQFGKDVISDIKIESVKLSRLKVEPVVNSQRISYFE